MGRARKTAVLGASLLAFGLAGCSGEPVIDQLPESLGGLPAGAPARPTTAYQYPAVHDMPPPRTSKPLSEEEQVKLEKDLQATRERTASQGDKGKQGDKGAAPAKKKPAAAKTGRDTGIKTHP